MGLFDFGKKKDEQPKQSKEVSMAKFNDYVKDAMQTDKKGSFFLLMMNNGFSGKALMGDSSQFEDMFGQLFHEHPEILDLLQEIITRYKNGELRFRKTGTTKQPIGDDIKKLAEDIVGEGNINKVGPINKSESEDFNSDEKKMLNDLLNVALGKNPEGNKPNPADPHFPRHKMKEEYEKHQKEFNKQGLVDYNLDEIRKRNKEKE